MRHRQQFTFLHEMLKQHSDEGAICNGDVTLNINFFNNTFSYNIQVVCID